MSFLYMDGCDWPAAVADIEARYINLATLNSTNYGVTTTGGAFGGGAIQLKGVSTAVSHGVRLRALGGTNSSFTATNTLLVGAWVKAVVVGAFTATHEEAFLKLRTATAEGATITFNPFNNEMKLYAGDGPGGTQLGTTATFDLDDGNWHWIEWKWVGSTAGAGSSTLKIDNTEVTNLTVTAATTLLTAITVTCCDLYPNFRTAGESIDVYIDDTFAVDTSSGAVSDFMGKRRIYTLRPNSDSSVQMTPSTGATNFGVVDEAALDETDYVEESTAGQADMYGHETYAGPAAINCVNAVCNFKRSAGTTASVNSRITSDATTVSTGNISVATTIAGIWLIRDLDPDGDVAWATAALNAAIFGPRLNGGLGGPIVRCFQAFIEVMTSSQTEYTFNLDTGAFVLAGGATTKSVGRGTGGGSFSYSGGVSGRRHIEDRPEAREVNPRDPPSLRLTRQEAASLAKLRVSGTSLLKLRGQAASLSITGRVSSDD